MSITEQWAILCAGIIDVSNRKADLSKRQAKALNTQLLPRIRRIQTMQRHGIRDTIPAEIDEATDILTRILHSAEWKRKAQAEVAQQLAARGATGLI